MGWSFRKSKSIGPVRFNFSKSGIGVSTGVKGARVSFGPRGTYVNLGRNGIYYRKKIGSSTAKKSIKPSLKSDYKLKSQPNSFSKSYDFEDAIKVSNEPNANSRLGQEIISDINKSKSYFWAWIIISISLTYLFKEVGIIIAFVSGILSWRFFSARLNYELDDEAKFEWEKMIESLYTMRNSKKLWLIEGMSYNSNIKINAGAYRNISRSDASVRLLNENGKTGFKVKSNVKTALIESKRCKILFLPSGVLIKKGSNLAAYTYGQIQLRSSTTNFIENGLVAKDAEIIRRTWQYVNKNGGPDRRYKNNRQLPVCMYGTLNIESENLDIELQTSNKLVTKNIDSAYEHYRKYVGNLGGFANSAQNYSQLNNSYLSAATRTNNNQFVSNEERRLLEEMDNTLRDLGINVYVGVLKDLLECEVNFIDAQLYNKHALFLYRTNKSISNKLKFLEECLNAYTPYQNDVESVSDNEFLIHLYMDNLSDFNIYLPLSSTLRSALDKASVWKQDNEKKAFNLENNSVEEFGDVLAKGATLFSGEMSSATHSIAKNDPYADLFELEDNKNHDYEPMQDDTDIVDDLMDYFDEE